MDEIRIEVYHERATQLADAMELCHDSMADYASAVALLAVHSAISFNDALLTRLTGKRPKGDDHERVVSATRNACVKDNIEMQGIKHLARLLSAKTDISYGDKEVEYERIETLYETARRFQTWAERVIKRKGKKR